MRVLQTGRYCHVVLAEDENGRYPAGKGFFDHKRVDLKCKTKMQARLRRIAQSGFPVTNATVYKCIDGDIHYIKVHGYRAYCLRRETRRGTELVVCLVVEKRHDGPLHDDLKLKARRIFSEHCEIYP